MCAQFRSKKENIMKGGSMSESSLSINPAIEPFAGGVIGLGVGYSLAPRKYSLKRLLILRKDVFDRIYSDNLISNMTNREKAAVRNIQRARQDYRTSKHQIFEQVRETAARWRKEFVKVDVPEAMINQYNENRKNLQEAIKSTDYINVNKEFRQAKQALKKAPNDENLKAALKAANENLARVKAQLASKIEIYKNSVKNISNERLYNIKSNPTKWVDVKDAYHEFLAALAKRRTISSNKLFELSNNKALKKSYDIIKDFLPRARTRSALTWGVVLGSLTALLAAYINPSARRA